MGKRKYQQIAALLPEIKAMLSDGKSQREIETYFGLEGYRPIHQLLKRERKKEKKIAAGIMPRPKGRPRKGAEPKDIMAEQAYEIQRLKMENKLLRDFLQLTRRR